VAGPTHFYVFLVPHRGSSARNESFHTARFLLRCYAFDSTPNHRILDIRHKLKAVWRGKKNGSPQTTWFSESILFSVPPLGRCSTHAFLLAPPFLGGGIYPFLHVPPLLGGSVYAFLYAPPLLAGRIYALLCVPLLLGGGIYTFLRVPPLLGSRTYAFSRAPPLLGGSIPTFSCAPPLWAAGAVHFYASRRSWVPESIHFYMCQRGLREGPVFEKRVFPNSLFSIAFWYVFASGPKQHTLHTIPSR